MKHWHALKMDELFEKLKSSSKGLENEEIADRQKEYGLNVLAKESGHPWIRLLIAQFTNIMAVILIVAMVVSFLAKESIDAFAIGAIILLNAGIGFLQEYRAEKAVEALQKMAAPLALVLRSGKTLQIDAKELVPGDLVFLEEGAQVPADIRLIEASQLQAIESSLTGESQSVDKAPGSIEHHQSLGDLSNMMFMGTVISRGHGLGLVVSTGMKTELGKIAHMVQSEHAGPSPLQLQLSHLSRWIAIVVVSLSVLLFISSIFLGRDPLEMFLLSISLAVSVIPEGLPTIITLTLALGVQKMARNKAIVRRLAAAETLGGTTAICTDKTGTLTQNQMTVKALYVGGRTIEVSGQGYEPKGDLFENGKTLPHFEELDELLRAAALCNNAKLFQNQDVWTISGDPTEACLLTLTQKSGLDINILLKENPREQELVFDSDRKLMSTLHGERMYTKGAPDAILEACTHIQIDGEIQALTKPKKDNILKMYEQYAASAYRVLGFAKKQINDHKEFTEEHLVFLGLAGMMDPPREEVKAAIEECKKAHIKVVMITGDHALTAQAIGKSIGLYENGDAIMTGAELEQLSESELFKKVEKIKIYARVNPAHKVKILKALQAHKHVVAMTGDGVNDAPALKSADIGIAMGITGTDVSKQASQMILTDDNFSTIVHAIENGRVVYRNIKKSIRCLLSANAGEVLAVSALLIMGHESPLLPLQILWINLMTDALPALALGVDTGEKDIMSLKPRKTGASLWKEVLGFSIVAGVLCTILCIFLYLKELSEGSSIGYIRTLIFTSIVVFELLSVFSARFEDKHYFTDFFKNKALLASIVLSFMLQILALRLGFLQKILGTQVLENEDWVWMLGLSLIGIVILEIWKSFRPKAIHV